MISRIVLVCVIALVSYIILPEMGRVWMTMRWKLMLKRLRFEPGESGYCTGHLDAGLRVQLEGMNRDAFQLISPKNTVFLMLRKNEGPEKLAWRTFFLLQYGTTLYYIQSKKRFKPDICLFYEEKNTAALKEQINSLTVPSLIPNPVKPYCVASGAFLEFLLFLQYIRNPELGIASIASLVAIFGKALPYFPPGLLFTVAAARFADSSPEEKKRGQRKAAGILLVTTGILLNIVFIFFVIRNISF